MSEKVNENNKKTSVYVLLWRIVALDFRLKRKHSLFTAVAVVLMSGLASMTYALQLPALEGFIESVSRAVNGAGLGAVYGPAALMCGLMIVSTVLEGMTSYWNDLHYTRIRTDLMELTMKSLSKKEPICFEDPKTLDCIEKAKRGIDSFEEVGMYLMSRLPDLLVSLVVVTVYLGQKSLILGILAPLTCIPMLLAQKLLKDKGADMEEKRAPVSRACDYMHKCLTDRETFKETRLMGAFGYFYRRMKEHLTEYCRLDRRLMIDKTRVEIGANIVSLTGYAALLVVMIFELSAGRISVAAFAATFAGLLSVYQMISYALLNIGSMMNSEIPKSENLFKVFDLPERQGRAAEADGLKGVRLQNVRFRYPGAETEAVRGVTLDIAPRETIAIVGENGAGKTTLVRLLTGLYLPTEGSVQIGGEDTRDIGLPSAVQNASAVFQKYMKYRMTLHENVRISAMGKKAEIAAPLSQAGLPLTSDCFPQGEGTMLSREFDGVDLSGGQWQRVAIARGLYRAHGMIVLDEPTAAIDPLEETRVYKKFAELAWDKTAVIVTHRMGSARIADRIIVMKDGVIDDIGDHETLMARGGEYARMVNAQAEWYGEGEETASAGA